MRYCEPSLTSAIYLAFAHDVPSIRIVQSFELDTMYTSGWKLGQTPHEVVRKAEVRSFARTYVSL
jgi:hypothetical protein